MIEEATQRRAMNDALDAQPELGLVARVDLRSGLVLAAEVRDGVSADALGALAIAATQLCRAPSFEGDASAVARESLVVSATGVHALVVSRRDADLAVVGAAGVDVNVALLVALLRRIADAAAPTELP